MRFSPYPWAGKDMIGGNAALDFANTAEIDKQTEEVIDHLGGPEGFAQWARIAGLLTDAEAARARLEMDADPKAAERAFKQAVRLRGALWRIFIAIAADGDVSEDDLEIFDECKLRAARCGRLVREGDHFRRRCAEETPALDGAMRLIVEAAEDLLLNGRLNRLHACGSETCDWLFLDLSKNGRRRWCSMETCGNKAKVKKFRKRNKDAA